MVYFVSALYYEAKPFIRFLKLKKNREDYKLQLFQNENVMLCITGEGPIEAAIKTACFLTAYKPSKKDILVNIGGCTSSNKNLKLGTVILGNQILEQATKRRFYPDILFSHPFLEGTIKTCFNKTQQLEQKNILAEEQASGIYQAGKLFLQPHQMIFLKIVLNYINEKEETEREKTDLIEEKTQIIIEWCLEIEKILQSQESFEFTQAEKQVIDKIEECLKLSVSMKHNLYQNLYYYKLKKQEIEKPLYDFLEEKGLLQEGKLKYCNSKREGKLYLEDLNKKVLFDRETLY